MKKRNVILSALALVLSLAVVMQGVVSVNAASSEVQIEVKATDMNLAVTVPSQIPVVFNEDGTNTYPTEWKIKNESTIAGIYLNQVQMDAGDSGWQVVASTIDTKELPANTKKIKFSMGKAGNLKVVNPSSGTESTVGVLIYGNQDIQILAGEEAEIDFEVERCAFTEGAAMQKAFDVELTFAFM